jgi:hypothetical protein
MARELCQGRLRPNRTVEYRKIGRNKMVDEKLFGVEPIGGAFWLPKSKPYPKVKHWLRLHVQLPR